MKQFLISIIMPVYNPEDSDLEEAIKSCVNQNYHNWELCIHDDGSTKKTIKKIIKKWVLKDKRIKATFSDKNEHICIAQNNAIKLSKGEYVGFLDHDDKLNKNALIEVSKIIKNNKNVDIIYTDEEIISEKGKTVALFFKPDWSPEYFLANNYLNHLTIINSKLIKEFKGFEKGMEGAQDYDLLLKITEKKRKIIHIPQILYSWRISKESILKNLNNKKYAYINGKKALEKTLIRRKINAEVKNEKNPGNYKVEYRILKNSLISIIIPFKDKIKFTRRCIESILNETSYKNYEIILINNKSSEKETIDYLKKLKKIKRIRIINYNKKFNFSKINNIGSKKAKGEYLIFLNNDTKILNKNWLNEMLSLSQLRDVGIVGPKFLFPTGLVQNMGISYNKESEFYQTYSKFSDNDPGYIGHRKDHRRNVIAVLGACLMIKKSLFQKINGFDENLKIEKNDVDICLRVKEKGYQIISTPYSKIMHHQSISRKGMDIKKDNEVFWKKWKNFNGDPFTNDNIELSKNFILKSSPYLTDYKKSKKKFYKIPYYCLIEQGINYSIRRTIYFLINPKMIIRLIKDNN